MAMDSQNPEIARHYFAHKERKEKGNTADEDESRGATVPQDESSDWVAFRIREATSTKLPRERVDPGPEDFQYREQGSTGFVETSAWPGGNVGSNLTSSGVGM
jgi:hypothetical protein